MSEEYTKKDHKINLMVQTNVVYFPNNKILNNFRQLKGKRFQMGKNKFVYVSNQYVEFAANENYKMGEFSKV